MTPEEIIQKFNAALIMRKGTIAATAEAVEDINQLCRDMCDKQKENCLESYCKDINGQLTLRQSIGSAPYPTDLL